MSLSSSAAASSPSGSFSQFDFIPSIVKALADMGFSTPTPIQTKAIPVALEGRDMIGLAQTGTGKTAAFVLPMLQHLSKGRHKGVRALVLAPTRELADQINEVVRSLSFGSSLKSVTIYGGVSHNRQIEELRRGPDIVVACPGRLLDHLQGGTIKLDAVEMLVLDEADRMFDMGFLPVVRRIVKAVPRERHTMLFSATMPPEIQRLTDELLVDPEVVRVRAETPVATITHSMVPVADGQKGEALKAWLSENPEAIAVVFTKMKHTAKRIAQRLDAAGYPATSLQGNLSQNQRQRALAGFKDGTYRIMVATDIAARGIDVDGVTHVINYDMADTLESYIHRTGRAGRNSRTGEAITFVTREDAPLVRAIEKWLKTPLNPINLDIPNPPPQSNEREQGEERRSNRGERNGRSSQGHHGAGRHGAGRSRDGRRGGAAHGQRREQGASGRSRQPVSGNRDDTFAGRADVNGNRVSYRGSSNLGGNGGERRARTWGR